MNQAQKSYPNVSGSRKVLAVLVKRYSHYPVCDVECLLHAVAMMNVNVNVKHALVHPEELQNCEHNVVDVAKARGFCLFSVMKATRPVDGNIALFAIQPGGSL